MFTFETLYGLLNHWKSTANFIVKHIFKCFFNEKYEKNEYATSKDNLFIGVKAQYGNFQSTFKGLRSCAVDEYDLSYSTHNQTQHEENIGSSNPFNWDLNSLVMDNNTDNNRSSAISADDTTTLKEVDNEDESRKKGLVTNQVSKPANQYETQIAGANAIFSDDEESSDDDEEYGFPLDDELNFHYLYSKSTVNDVTKEIPGSSSKNKRSGMEMNDKALMKSEEAEEEVPDKKRLKKYYSMNDLDTGAISSFSTTNDINGKLFSCELCGAHFNVKGYLTRHMKKHATKKPFICPFYDESLPSKCHQTGGFSRRDTFKTHLKALHFVYPTGTKSAERVCKSGRCAGCFKKFDSNVSWLNEHVALNKCESMIAKYH